jgi:cytochrome c oxidase subunit 2
LRLPRPRTRRPAAASRRAVQGGFFILLASALTLVVAGPAFADALTPEAGGGSANAQRIDELYKITLYIAIVVFLGVQGALFYSVFKFRARKGAVPAQIRGNTRLEIGWTIGAALILVVLSVVTFSKLDSINTPDNSGPGAFRANGQGVLYASTDRRLPPDGRELDIKVNGQQYVWRFTYPDGDDNTFNNPFAYTEMVVPTNTTITLDITGQDVVHSWWIPELGGKMDAVPGYHNYTWFKVTKPGRYRGQCAELCGRNHADMVASVRAIPAAEFDAWLAQRKRDIEQANKYAQTSRAQADREQEGDTAGEGEEGGQEAPSEDDSNPTDDNTGQHPPTGEGTVGN